MTAAPDRGASTLVGAEEFFADPAFSRASLSPDGARIAYLAPERGKLNLWVRRVDEGHEDAVCLTHDDRRGVEHHWWTDDPRWLLYLHATDGEEDWHLFRVDLDAPGAPAVDLTPLPPGQRVFAVDPTRPGAGSVLVWMNQRPASIDAVRVDVATGERTPHQSRPEPGGTVLLDGRGEPAFHAALTEDGTWEFSAIDPGGRRRLLWRVGGPEHPLGPPLQRVTPDGTGLLVGDYQDSDDLRLVRIDRRSGAETTVAAVAGRSLCTAGLAAPGARPPTVFTSRRTGAVIAARFTGDRPHIEVLDPHFAEVHAALSALSDGVLDEVSSDETEQRWVASFVHDREPGATWFYDHSTGERRLLFRAHPQLDPAQLAPMSAVRFPARDGLLLHAFLTLPVDGATGPLVLLVHGGPWSHDSWGYHPTVQFLANRGYAVLQVNVRGSTGCGKRYTTAAIGEFAGKVHDDLLDALDWAVAQGHADPSRVALVGDEDPYAGHAALVGAALSPDRFAAAVARGGLLDLAHFLRTSPPFTRPALAHSWFRYVGDPADPEQEADLLACSPITMLDRIRSPLLLVRSADEVESDTVVERLRARGVPVEQVSTDGSRGPEDRVRLHRAIERHLAEHLGGRRG